MQEYFYIQEKLEHLQIEDKLKKFMRNRMGIYLLKPSSTEHTKL